MSESPRLPSYRLPILLLACAAIFTQGPFVFHDAIVAEHGPGAFRVTVITAALALLAGALATHRTTGDRRRLALAASWVLLGASVLFVVLDLNRAQLITGAAMLGVLVGVGIAQEREHLAPNDQIIEDGLSLGGGLVAVFVLSVMFAAVVGAATGLVALLVSALIHPVDAWGAAFWTAGIMGVLSVPFFTGAWRRTVTERYDDAVKQDAEWSVAADELVKDDQLTR